MMRTPKEAGRLKSLTSTAKTTLCCLVGALVVCCAAYGSEEVKSAGSPTVPLVAGPGEPDVADLKARIQAEPSNAALHTKLGYLLLQKGAFEDARASFEQALKLNPRAHDAMTGIGIVLRKQGNLAEAERTLTGALRLNPNPVRAHYELGLVYEQLGLPDKAIREFKEGIWKHEQGR